MFVRAVQLVPPRDGRNRRGYPWDLPAIAALADPVALDPRVTYLVGENGSGKSTLLEAIAVAAGMNPEGGSSNYAFSTRDSHSGSTCSTSPRSRSRRRTASRVSGASTTWSRRAPSSSSPPTPR